MPDERLVQAADVEDAVENTPSLAFALLARPELLVAGDLSLTQGAIGDDVNAKAQNRMHLRKDTAREL